jgi:hypothetical protein
MNQIVNLIRELSTRNKNVNRESIVEYEEFAAQQPQVEVPTAHLASGGMYAREIVIPAGTVLTGQIYKYDHIDVMVSGHMIVSTDEGDVRELAGFNMFASQSGKKRAGYAIEDTHWVTINMIPEGYFQSGDEIQSAITVPDFTSLAEFYAEASKLDYASMVESMEIDNEVVQAQSDSLDDYVENESQDGYFIASSPIHGYGLFASRTYEVGENIGVARNGKNRTELGRYTNHCIKPNARYGYDFDSGNMILVAIERIYDGDEITTNYRDTLAMRAQRGDLCQE